MCYVSHPGIDPGYRGKRGDPRAGLVRLAESELTYSYGALPMANRMGQP